MKTLNLTKSSEIKEAKIVVDLTNERRENYLVLGEKELLDNITSSGYDGVEHYLKKKEIEDFFSQTNDELEIAKFINNMANNEEYLQILKEMKIIDYQIINKEEMIFDDYDNCAGEVEVPDSVIISINYKVAAAMYLLDGEVQFTDDDVQTIDDEVYLKYETIYHDKNIIN